MAKPLLLSYNLKPGAEAGLEVICRNLGIHVRKVTPGEYGTPIGALAGKPIPATAPTETFDDEMLVICHVLSDELDSLLKAMREAGVRIGLKAVLTPFNVAWNSMDLHTELSREHNEIQRRNP